jgi:CBS domain protein
VTLEDLIEEVMGNIADEYDDEDLSIRQLSPNKYLISGDVSLNDLNDAFHIELESKYYDTLSGLLIEKLGYIPEDDEKISPITIDGIEFKPQRVRDKKIEKIIVIFLKKIEMQEKVEKEKNTQ